MRKFLCTNKREWSEAALDMQTPNQSSMRHKAQTTLLKNGNNEMTKYAFGVEQ
jgi:hypothetical protein